MKEPLEKRLEVLFDQKTLSRLDEWRRAQEDLPSRSEAVRRLIYAGFRTTGFDILVEPPWIQGRGSRLPDAPEKGGAG